MKKPNLSFTEVVNKRRRISFSLSEAECAPQEINSKFAYICHFQQTGKKTRQSLKTGIHFKSDIFAAVAVVDAKARC